MIEKPYSGRAKIDYDGIGLKIIIPSKKNWFVIIFLAAWMGGWYMGESSALKEIMESDNIGISGFMLFWIIGWTIGGLFALVILLWSLLGQETITLEKPILRLEKGILNLNIIRKAYDIQSIKNLELNPVSTISDLFGQKNKIGDFWGFTGGRLRFDYGMKTIKFGIGIDEAEARYLIEQLKIRGYFKEN